MKRLYAFLIVASASLVLTSCLALTKPTENDEAVQKADSSRSEEQTPVVPEAPKYEVVSLTLYFPDNDALYLHKEERNVVVSKEETLAAVVLEELFKGPEGENLSPCLDGKDLVSSVEILDGICTVDFKEDFAILNSGGSARETFVIGSIVNSLCSLEGVYAVKINIGGDDNAAFGGHFTLEAPFSPQEDLISSGVHNCP